MQAPIRNTLLGVTFSLVACAAFAQTPAAGGRAGMNATTGSTGAGAPSTSTPASGTSGATAPNATKPSSASTSASGKSASSAKTMTASHKHVAAHHTMMMHHAAASDRQEVAFRSALRQCVSGPQDRRDNCIDQTLTHFGRG